MCEFKKLCTCESVNEGEDHWRLDYFIGMSLNSGPRAVTRPEHQQPADEFYERSFANGVRLVIYGPAAEEVFSGMAIGTSTPASVLKTITTGTTYSVSKNQKTWPSCWLHRSHSTNGTAETK